MVQERKQKKRRRPITTCPFLFSSNNNKGPATINLRNKYVYAKTPLGDDRRERKCQLFFSYASQAFLLSPLFLLDEGFWEARNCAQITVRFRYTQWKVVVFPSFLCTTFLSSSSSTSSFFSSCSSCNGQFISLCLRSFWSSSLLSSFPTFLSLSLKWK